VIFRGDPYVMLMASLPSIRLLSEKEPPINRARLTERLRELTPEDVAVIDAVRSILRWDQIDFGNDDAEFIARLKRVLAIVRSPDLRAAIVERMEIRTLIAALRRRHAGEDAPARGTVWGFGRHVERIRTNWGLPDFGLQRTYPWVLAAKEQLERGDSAGLERLVLETAWQAVARREQGHEFDLEAVAFYLTRWALAERWARYDAEAAARRFAEMLDAAAGEAPAREGTA